VTFATEYPGASLGIGVRPRGSVTIGGDAAGTVVVVVEVVVVDVEVVVAAAVVVDDTDVDVLVDEVVAARVGDDEPHAALTIRSTAQTLLRPRRRCTPS
jgi:hypothetical protein